MPRPTLRHAEACPTFFLFHVLPHLPKNRSRPGITKECKPARLPSRKKHFFGGSKKAPAFIIFTPPLNPRPPMAPPKLKTFIESLPGPDHHPAANVTASP